MSRTNIEIDDELIEDVMRRHRLDSKRQAVDVALRRMAASHVTTEEILALEGVGWSGDLEEIRDDDAEYGCANT